MIQRSLYFSWNRLPLWLAIIIMILPLNSYSQAFLADTTINLPGSYSGDLIWGDYDGDDDLDILSTGVLDEWRNMQTAIFRNDGGEFTEIETNLLNVGYSDADWGDYDNDGDLDILIIGQTNGLTDSTKIYRNDGNGVFTEIQLDLNGFNSAAAQWGDYDNDGDLDIFITAGYYYSKIFYNEGNSLFSDSGISLDLFAFSASSADYDGDGDLDIFVYGKTDNLGTRVCRLYRNDGLMGFSAITFEFYPAQWSEMAWGDYDNDGDLDLLLSGDEADLDPETIIYRNDGDDSFTDIDAGLIGAGQVSWGDYDNDGLLDVLLAGGWFAPKVYHNQGNDLFSDINATLPEFLSNCIWGDYDNDGDLDILLNSTEAYFSEPLIYTTLAYRNESSAINTPPTAPLNLTAVTQGDSAILSWTTANDTETPTAGLSYNLQIGTAPGGQDIFSPMANSLTGYVQFVGLGNVGQDTTWIIRNLPEDDYFWSIQAIDNAYLGSSFSVGDSFRVEYGPPSAPHEIEAIPGDMLVTLNWSPGLENDLNYFKIYRNGLDDSLSASFIDSVFWPSISFFDTNVINDSTYYYWISAVDDPGNEGELSTGVSVTPHPIDYGDVSLNGEVHAYDASLILSHLIGQYELSPQQRLNADVNADTHVSAWDAALIFQYVVGLYDSLPIDDSEARFLASGDIEMENVGALPGTLIELPIGVTNAGNIMSFNGVISYDPLVLMPADEIISWSEAFSGFSIEIDSEIGLLTFAGAAVNPAIADSILAVLHFYVNEDFNLNSTTTVTLESLHLNGNRKISDILATVIGVVGTETGNSIPSKYFLDQNYPNPFNPSTLIRYGIPVNSTVSLVIYDVSGREIRSLVKTEQVAGLYTLSWDGNNNAMAQVATGLYFARLSTGDRSQVIKMVFLR